MLDPNLFLNESSEEYNYQINSSNEVIDKRSECEKSMKKDSNGKVSCSCQKRTFPKPFNKEELELYYDNLSKTHGENSQIFEEFLKMKFSSSAMNICKTQPLNKMKVSPMFMELKKLQG